MNIALSWYPWKIGKVRGIQCFNHILYVNINYVADRNANKLFSFEMKCFLRHKKQSIGQIIIEYIRQLS